MCNSLSAPVSVGSFSELDLAVSSGARAIEVAAPTVVFDHQLLIENTVLHIESMIDATLSGGYQTRLFFLRDGSQLSICGIGLLGGIARGNSSECPPHGGAIFVSAGCKLTLRSAGVVNNRAVSGGAIYAAIRSTVIATDCMITSNIAWSGGAIFADDNSTVILSNCTLTSNSASWGGALSADGDSVVTSTDCTMTSNSAIYGGAVFGTSESTLILADCALIANAASWGGAVVAVGSSTAIATNCMMTANSVDYGGGVFLADGDSTVTATDCTMTLNSAHVGAVFHAASDSTAISVGCVMTSNSASLGGAFYTGGDSIVISADCAMTSNSASWGGAVFASSQSTVISADCAMNWNSASWGGAVYANIGSTVMTKNCTLMSNSARWWGGAMCVDGDSTAIATNCKMTANSVGYGGGGAVFADGDSTVTATGCTLTSNTAYWGGAVAVGANSSLTAAMATFVNCALTSNTASSGAALFVYKSGIADLVNSMFDSNVGNDLDDGVGIANLNGQVQCDAIVGCLPVCTVCQDEEAPSLLPTRPPTELTAAPTYATTPNRTRGKAGTTEFTAVYVSLLVLCSLAVSAMVVSQLWRCKLCRDAERSGGEGNEGFEISLLQPLVTRRSIERSSQITLVTTDNDASKTTRSPDEHEVPSQIANLVPFLPCAAIESSPASIFAIDREMRIVSWSQGACSSRSCEIAGPRASLGR